MAHMYVNPFEQEEALYRQMMGQSFSLFGNLALQKISQNFQEQQERTRAQRQERVKAKELLLRGDVRKAKPISTRPDISEGVKQLEPHTEFGGERLVPQQLETIGVTGTHILERHPVTGKYTATQYSASPGTSMWERTYQTEVAAGKIDPQKTSFSNWYMEQQQKLSPTTIMEVTPEGGMRTITGAGQQPTKLLGTPSTSEYTAVRQQEAASKTSLDLIGSLMKQVDNDPQILGLVGGTHRFLDSATHQLQAAAQAAGGWAVSQRTGKPISERSLLNPGSYDFSNFRGKATKSAAFKSRSVQLAYVLARSLDPSGRLSDFDVQIQLDRLGLRSGSPLQIKAALATAAADIKTAYTSRHESIYRKPPTFDWLSLDRYLPFKTPEEVRTAVHQGIINPDEGVQLLQRYYGFE